MSVEMVARRISGTDSVSCDLVLSPLLAYILDQGAHLGKGLFMRKSALLLVLAMAVAITLPAGATDPNTNGTITTNVVNNQVTHCANASLGLWAFNEFCAKKPTNPASPVVAYQVRLPGLPAGVGKGCMIHGQWVMIYISPVSGAGSIVINQPVVVIWIHETQSPVCKFVA